MPWTWLEGFFLEIDKDLRTIARIGGLVAAGCFLHALKKLPGPALIDFGLYRIFFSFLQAKCTLLADYIEKIRARTPISRGAYR